MTIGPRSLSARLAPLALGLGALACTAPQVEEPAASRAPSPSEQVTQAPGRQSAWTLGGAYHVSVEADPFPLPLNEPFDLKIRVAPKAVRAKEPMPVEVTVRAWMPSHGHGMLRTPEVSAVEPGRWVASGMLFHMSGRWEVRVEVVDARGRAAVLFPFDLR